MYPKALYGYYSPSTFAMAEELMKTISSNSLGICKERGRCISNRILLISDLAPYYSFFLNLICDPSKHPNNIIYHQFGQARGHRHSSYFLLQALLLCDWTNKKSSTNMSVNELCLNPKLRHYVPLFLPTPRRPVQYAIMH